MGRWLVLALAVALSGCAEFAAFRSGVATHGAQAADAALDTGKWQVCTATTVGALERELGGDAERIAGWRAFCGKRPGPHPLHVTTVNEAAQ